MKRYMKTSGAMVETFDTFEGKPTGEWVRYDDHLRELAEAQRALDDIRMAIGTDFCCCGYNIGDPRIKRHAGQCQVIRALIAAASKPEVGDLGQL